MGAIAAAAVGEMVNVNHAFHPDGRLTARNSPYPQAQDALHVFELRLRASCVPPIDIKAVLAAEAQLPPEIEDENAA